MNIPPHRLSRHELIAAVFGQHLSQRVKMPEPMRRIFFFYIPHPGDGSRLNRTGESKESQVLIAVFPLFVGKENSPRLPPFALRGSP